MSWLISSFFQYSSDIIIKFASLVHVRQTHTAGLYTKASVKKIAKDWSASKTQDVSVFQARHCKKIDIMNNKTKTKQKKNKKRDLHQDEHT